MVSEGSRPENDNSPDTKKEGKERQRYGQRATKMDGCRTPLTGTGGYQIETKDIYKEGDKAKTSIDSDRQSALLAHGDSGRAEPLGST